MLNVEGAKFRWTGYGKPMHLIHVIKVPDGCCDQMLECGPRDIYLTDSRPLRFRLVYNQPINVPLPPEWAAPDTFEVEFTNTTNRWLLKTSDVVLVDPEFRVYEVPAANLPQWSHFYLSFTPKADLPRLDFLWGVEFDTLLPNLN